MANTRSLLELIDEFSSAFADPDFPVEEPVKAITEETSTTESEGILETPEEESELDICHYYLSRLEHEPRLIAIASRFLSELADVAALRQMPYLMDPQGTTPVTISKGSIVKTLDLPETYARQGSSDCPSGACPIDH
jgi:hypothetical protein